MTRGNWLLGVTFTLLLMTLALRANEPQAPPAQSPNVSRPETSSDYLGSSSCARCHDAEHTQWKNSLHIKMTKPIADATVLGDLSLIHI